MTWPRITNAEAIMVATQAKPAEDAFRLGLEEMVKWLAEDYGFTPQEAYLYLGQVLEARATQFVNPTFTYLLKVRRDTCRAAGQAGSGEHADPRPCGFGAPRARLQRFTHSRLEGQSSPAVCPAA